MIGLGKLGLPSILAIESRGYDVYGYDVNPEIKKYVENRKIPYREEGAEELLQKTNLMVLPMREVLEKTDICFVAVQTPHDPMYEGITPLPISRVDFNYSILIQCINRIIYVIQELNEETDKRKKERKHFVISIISTVLPGTMYREIIPLIPAGLDNLHIVYNPFFIAMGTTIKDFLYPEFVLFGVDDLYPATIVEEFYNSALPSIPDREPEVPKVFRCSIDTAEAIKVLYNTYITQKICFANAAMELCEKTGADVDDLINCLQLGTRRITSGSYMRAGMGDGGGCHPRDNIALSFIAKKLDISYDWWENLMICREKQTQWFAEIIEREYYVAKCELDIMILGYSFKPETSLTIGSPALLLKHFLDNCGILDEQIKMFDPFIDDTTIYGMKGSILKSKDLGTRDMIQFITEPHIFFIGTKHDAFSRFIFPVGSIVIDPFRYILDQDGVTIKRIGEGKNKF